MFIDKDANAKILDSLNDGLYLVDLNRKIIFWNKAAERITGYSSAEVVGTYCADNILTHIDDKGNNLCLGLCPLAKSIADGETRSAELFLHHRSGGRMPVSVRVSSLTDQEGKVIGGVELFTDISHYNSLKMRMKELEELALIDNLTRLSNRNCLEREFSLRLEEFKRAGIPFGIIFIDIDHFKTFNDTYGHDTGDEVLKYVADTLIKNSRPFDAVGRWGGEEFLVVVRNVDGNSLEKIGDRFRILVENSYLISGAQKLSVTISLGATLFKPEDNLSSLIKRADELLYRSKKSGRNCLSLG